MGNHIMDNLPLLERDKALALYAACKRIKEASACRGLKMRAIDEAAAEQEHASGWAAVGHAAPAIGATS